jgi:hypothetical protein
MVHIAMKPEQYKRTGGEKEKENKKGKSIFTTFSLEMHDVGIQSHAYTTIGYEIWMKIKIFMSNNFTSLGLRTNVGI